MSLVQGLWTMWGISIVVWLLCTFIEDKWRTFIMTIPGLIGFFGSWLVFTASSVLLVFIGLYKLVKLIIGIF